MEAVMSLSNRQEWAFRATPRELQFFVVGIAVGILTVIIWRAASIPAEALLFLVMGLAVACMVLGAARSNNNDYR